MKKMMLFLTALLALTSLASAATVDCDTIGLLSELTSGPYSGVGSGCVSEDKLFTNFVYSPTGGVESDDVDVSIDFGEIGALDVHAVALQAGIVGWTSPFTLSYTVEATNNKIISLIGLDATFFGNFLGNVTQTNTPAGSVNPMVATSLGGAALSAHSASLLNVSITGNPGARSSIQQFVSTYVQIVEPQEETPEPATYALFGAGLLGLAFFRRIHS